MAHPESPLAPLLRFLEWSFRVGRFFGTEVRVYGAPIILILLVALPLEQLGAVPFGERLLLVVLGLLIVYVTTWIHEMGHVMAARHYRIQTRLITLSPLGGLAHLQGALAGPKADIVVSAAGPLTHLVALAVFWPLSRLVGGEPFTWSVTTTSSGYVFTAHPELVPWTLARLVELNLGLMLFNLLPSYPLDGGRIFQGLLALRMHATRAQLIAARVGMVGAVVMAVVGLFLVGGLGGGVLVALAITSFMACQRAALEARYTHGPYAEPRQPWEEDPDAWKDGMPLDEPPPRRRARPREREDDAPRGEELDQLLDRVKEVGLAGLSDAERAALLRASEARRSGR